jgi:glutamate-1-semialdehyde 2,1-aminomutase
MVQNGDASAGRNTMNCQELYKLAKTMIPGGTQLLSKRPELFAPDQWPGYCSEAHGCEIVDIDQRRYIDMTMVGVGACLLGYADPDVTEAVVKRVKAGSMCSLNPPEEVELARLLLDIHPWAENVRYARSGGESMAVAVRIARASTNRDVIAFCGYHGWHDWYLSANRSTQGGGDILKEHLLPGLSPNGVPTQLAGTALPFTYNQIDSLAKIVEQQGQRLAAVVMEPSREAEPAAGFLEGVRELCDRVGAVLVFDEITIGWRLAVGGSHLHFNVQPDIAVFAKALGNGHPIAAVIGRAKVMQAAQDSFISSTYWTEGVGPTAALATVRKMQQKKVPDHIAIIGTRWQQGIEEIARRVNLSMTITGYPSLMYIDFNYPDGLALQTLVTVRMLRHGFLSGARFYPTLAHTPEHVDKYLAAAEEVYAEVAEAARCGDAARRIGGPVRHAGFARLT